MKIKNTFLFLLVLAIACTSISCSDDESKSDGAGALTFSGTIGDPPRTRAAGSRWNVNDGVGMYMKEHSKELQTNILNEANNVEYTTPAGDGVFVATLSEKAISYPRENVSVDFVAYYPYLTLIPAYTYKINLTDQTNQASIDLLYSNNATNLNKSSSANVNLIFSHKLSKILINVTSSKGVASIADLKVITSGMMTKGNFNLGTGATTLDVTSVADISFLVKAETNKMVGEAIIMPADATSGRAVSFIYGSKEFSWNIPDGTAFVEGKRYTYNAELKEGAVVVINPEATIDDWDEIISEDIDAEFEEVPPAITLNQTAQSLNGLDVGNVISVKGNIASVFNLATAKLITTTADGLETEIDLLEGVSGDTKNLVFDKNITANASLRNIRIEAVDTNNQTTTIAHGVYVGYYYYNLAATGSGNDKFPPHVRPFLSAAKAQTYTYAEANGLSEFMDVGFATFSGNLKLTVAPIAKLNPGKFKHPEYNIVDWITKTYVQMKTSTVIKRSSITNITIADIQAETALETGGINSIYLTNKSLYVPEDVAVLYKISVGGADKRVLFAIDEIDNNTAGESIAFTLHIVVEK